MAARILQQPVWLLASVNCLAIAATGCKHPGTASQAPSASSGISASSPIFTLAQNTTGNAPWARPDDAPRHLAFGDHFGCAVAEPDTRGMVPGIVLCWGDTSSWLGAPGKPGEVRGPAVLPGLADVVEIQGSRSMCGRTTRGDVWCWGAQPGSWDPARITSMGPFVLSGPTRVDGIYNAVALAVAGTTACAVTGEGAVKCWGDNPQGTVGNGTNQKQPKPTVLKLDFKAVGVTLDEQNGCAWSTEGKIACWGRVQGGTSNPQYREPTNVPPIAQLVQLDLPGRCALLRNHTVQCWQGMVLADGSKPTFSQLSAVSNVSAAIALATTRDYGCAQGPTGQLRCWSNSLRRAIPGEVRAESQRLAHDLTQANRVVEFALGESQICVRRSDASLACWGDGHFGELGDAAASVRDEPHTVQLPPMVKATAPDAVSYTCQTDADCQWDNSINPAHCMTQPGNGRQVIPAVLKVGACRCQLNHCTWLHARSAPAQTVCLDYSDCRYVAEQSACRSREPSDTDGTSAYVRSGPFCDCHAGNCELTQIPEVPCKSDQDCWISDGVPHRPIPRPARLRGYKFKPCTDGEVAPMCNGVCSYDPRVWGC